MNGVDEERGGIRRPIYVLTMSQEPAPLDLLCYPRVLGFVSLSVHSPPPAAAAAAAAALAPLVSCRRVFPPSPPPLLRILSLRLVSPPSSARERTGQVVGGGASAAVRCAVGHLRRGEARRSKAKREGTSAKENNEDD